MTEENKSDPNEQQSFLSGHEELLQTLNDKKDAAENPAEKVKPVEEPPSTELIEVEEDVILETEREDPAPVSEPEVAAEEPATVATPKAVVEAPAVQVPKPKKKTGHKPAGRNNKPQHSPQHEELMKRQALEQQEVKEVLVFIQKYAKPAAIALAVICVLVLADKTLKSQRYKKEAAADSALLQAQGPEDLQAIIDDYASTPSKPIALMGLAREKFNDGQVDEAETLYTQFTKKHSDHELALQASLNLIACIEAKGQPEEASQLYSDFATANPDSYLAPSALMSKARCLEALGQLDQAQIIYEDIIVNFPEGTWSQLAQVKLKLVQAKKQ